MPATSTGTRDLPIASLARFPGNARRGNVTEIRASVRRLGQYRAIVVRDTGSGLVMDIVLGVVGALVGGFVFSMFGAAGVTGFNIYSALVAIVGAVVVLWLYHMLIGRRAL